MYDDDEYYRPERENERKWRKKKKKKEEMFGSCKRSEKAVKHEYDGDTNYCWCTRNSSQRLGGTGNQKKNSDYTDHSIFKIN